MALITLHLPISRVVVPTPYVRHIVSHLGGGTTDVVPARFQLACCDFAAYTVRRCQTGDLQAPILLPYWGKPPCRRKHH